VLVRGKQYMASQEGIDWQGAGDTYVEHYLYHLLGDPSLQMWAAPPVVFDPRKIFSRYIQLTRVNPGDPGFELQIRFPVGGGEPPAFGTVATVFSHGDAVGRGVVGGDGTVTIRPDIDKDADLTVSFQQDGALPAQDTVDDAPQPTPAPQKQQTSLTLVAPAQNPSGGQQVQFTGQLSPGFAGAPIKIEYKDLDSPSASFTDNVTTLKDGSYSDNVTFPVTPPDEDWTAQATYAGDASYLGSQSPLRRFVVSGNN
jgi:hypothetical protein